MIEVRKIRKFLASDGSLTFREVILDELGNVLRIADEPFFVVGKKAGDLFDAIESQVEAYALETLSEGDGKRIRAEGTVLDVRGLKPPFREIGDTWARVTTCDRCPHCGDDIMSTRAWEAELIECPVCARMFSVRRPRILKRVK